MEPIIKGFRIERAFRKTLTKILLNVTNIVLDKLLIELITVVNVFCEMFNFLSI